MALALEAAANVWRKVDAALAQGGNSTKGADPVIVKAFQALKESLVQRGNLDLQIIPFSDADIIQDTGLSPIGAVTSTVYALYVRKRLTGMDSFVRLYNATTNTAVASAFWGINLQVAQDEAFIVNPRGSIFGTDLTISADTGAGAGTESTSLDAGDGFVIVGA